MWPVAILLDNTVESVLNNFPSHIRMVVLSVQKKTLSVREVGGGIQSSETRMWTSQDARL